MESKTSSTCGETKALGGFRTRRKQCKECESKWQKEYRQANGEMLKLRACKHRQSNKEELNRLQREYRHANLDKTRANQNRYRQANREKLRSKQKKLRLINREKLKEYRQVNKEKIKGLKLKHRYGLSSIDLQRMLTEQDHRCKICLIEFSDDDRYNVDHCHKTGKIRGLLCVCCNLGLGRFKDNIDRLKQAVIYLEH